MFNIKPHELDRINMVVTGCISLHSNANGCSDNSMLLDIIPNAVEEESEFDCIEQERIETALPRIKKQMTEREAEVFEASFFTQTGDSRRQIARDLGMTAERARQLEKRSVQRFKALFDLEDAATG